ncbi:MAG: hypothetical protein COT74_09530 [Bdellovibrionales bacterium CG10_big_fil_rev_8_21_14_0_10_45_34]|nr:MAG: hypothetical protein COT74_09530 [Bdellovibrionales bacterium CG10_big_fil_rev_8_21_14_0_10_45_34]
MSPYALFALLATGLVPAGFYSAAQASVEELNVELKKSTVPTRMSKKTVERWILDVQKELPGKNLVLLSESYASKNSRFKAHHLECIDGTLNHVKDELKHSSKEYLAVRINDEIYEPQKARVASGGLDVVQDPTKDGGWNTNFIFSNIHRSSFAHPDADWKLETSQRTIGLLYISRDDVSKGGKALNIQWVYVPLQEAAQSNMRDGSLCSSGNVQRGEVHLDDAEDSKADLSLLVADQIQQSKIALNDVKNLMEKKALTTIHVQKASLPSSDSIVSCDGNPFTEVYKIAEVVPNFRTRRINADILDVGFSPGGDCLTAELKLPDEKKKKNVQKSQKSKVKKSKRSKKAKSSSKKPKKPSKKNKLKKT